MTQFFISFCTGCILIGALYILCPEGNISKPIKHIFSLLFLIIIISAANIPLKNIDFTFQTSAVTESENYEEMQISAAKYIFSEALTACDINFSEISIYTDKNDNDSIVITKVVIVSNESKDKILQALKGLSENREVEIINE